MDNSIETIWIEVRGKNKNPTFLIGAFYQPSSDEKEKQCWLEMIDRLIAEVYVKWNGMIIIAGDFNINLNMTQANQHNDTNKSYTHFP